MIHFRDFLICKEEIEIVVGYNLWVTERGRNLMLIEFSRDDPSELKSEATGKRMFRMIIGSFTCEPPWHLLGWKIEQLVLKDGELRKNIIDQGEVPVPNYYSRPPRSLGSES